MNTSGVQYEPCVVSFIDILGFRDVIKTRPAEEVYGIIKTLQKFTFPDEDEPARSMDEVRLYSRAFAQSVSDAIVRVRPFNTQYRDGAFVHEILDLLYAQIELVNIGLLVRAGVTVGDAYAGFNGEGPIFGPGMVRAYEIESQEAIFPRIVIDDYALGQHKSDERLRAKHNLLKHELDMLEDLLAVGEDGIHFIDYLKAARDVPDHFGTYLAFVEKHADMIRKGIVQKGDARTFRKFEWLRRYHNARVSPLRDKALSTRKSRSAFLDEFEADPEEYFAKVIV